MNKAKAKKTALDYLEPRFRVCIFDSSDSYEDANALENRFNAFVDDTITIDKFIQKNLLKEYIKELQKFVDDNAVEEESLFYGVCEFPVPYEKIKGKITFQKPE
jgi:hypothetical protein